MSTELSENLGAWDSVRSALGEVRATHTESRQFFLGVFDQLGEMLTELAGRKRHWDAEREQAEHQLASRAAQLKEDRTAIDARTERLSEQSRTAEEGGASLRQLLEDAKQEWADIREAQQKFHGQIAQLADAGGDPQLGQLIDAIRQQRAESQKAQQQNETQLEQLAAVVAGLADVKSELSQTLGQTEDARFDAVLAEIRQQRDELQDAQHQSQTRLDKLAAMAADLADVRAGLSKRDSDADDPRLTSVLDEIRQQRESLEAAKQQSGAQLDQLAAMAGDLADVRAALEQRAADPEDARLDGVLDEIRGQREELQKTQEQSQAQLVQLAAMAGELAGVRAELAERADSTDDPRLGAVLHEIREQRDELKLSRSRSQTQLDQLAALAGELAEVRAELKRTPAQPDDPRLDAVLDEIRQQQDRLQRSEQRSRAQLDQMAAMARELANFRAELSQRSEGEDDPRLGSVLEEIRQQREELRQSQRRNQSQLDQLAAMAGDLADVRAELGRKDGKTEDPRLDAVLDEIRQQRSGLERTQQQSQSQLEKLGALASELSDVRAALAHQATEPEDPRLAAALDELHQQRAELQKAQVAARAQIGQLATVSAELTQARAELSETRGELAERWARLEEMRPGVASGASDDGLKERLESLQQQQASLEQERAMLETELEAVHRRAAEMAESLAEQKRMATSQRGEFADELKRMRRLLEAVSCRLIEGDAAAAHRPAENGNGRNGSGSQNARAPADDAVLDSVAAQFQMLQKDLAQRRAARSER